MNNYDLEDIISMNEYEQNLMKLKEMINNKNKFSGKHQIPHNIAIEGAIYETHISGHDASIPENIIIRDIENAMKGGKVSNVLHKPTMDIINIGRKKKLSSKPKRKPVKCSCKKK